MKCSNCNKIFDDELEFCPYCGIENNNIRFCRKCETKHLNIDRCPKCGTKLPITEKYINKLKSELVYCYEGHILYTENTSSIASESYYVSCSFDEDIFEELLKFDFNTGRFWFFGIYVSLLNKDSNNSFSSSDSFSKIYEKELYYLSKIAEINPQADFYWYAKVEILLRSESYEEVINIIDTKLDNPNYILLNNLFKGFKPEENWMKFKPKWETIILNELDSSNHFHTLKFKTKDFIKAECLEKLGRYDEALILYEKNKIFTRKGLLLEKLGKDKEALENYIKSLKLSDDDYVFLKNNSKIFRDFTDKIIDGDYKEGLVFNNDYILDYGKIKSRREELAQYSGYLPYLLRYCMGSEYLEKYKINLREKDLFDNIEPKLYPNQKLNDENSWREIIDFVEINPQFYDFIHPLNSMEGKKILEKNKKKSHENIFL